MNSPKYIFYIISRDYGFAPNPFHGFCTLACCKSGIRKIAEKGDWIIGLGSQNLACREHLIYAMKVTETLTFNEYYKDERFNLKKPNVKGSLKVMHGDNVYHRTSSKAKWKQDDCHHHHKDMKIRCENIQMDTKVDKVLISEHFFYFGDKCLSEDDLQELKKVNSKTNKLNQGYLYKGLEKEGNLLVNRLNTKYKKNWVYGDPINWSRKPYKQKLQELKRIALDKGK